MSDATIMGGTVESEAPPGAAAPLAVMPLKEVKYVQDIGRFEDGQSVADATFDPCTLESWLEAGTGFVDEEECAFCGQPLDDRTRLRA